METNIVLLAAGADPTMKISIGGQLKSVLDEMSDNMTPKSPNRSNKVDGGQFQKIVRSPKG